MILSNILSYSANEYRAYPCVTVTVVAKLTLSLVFSHK